MCRGWGGGGWGEGRREGDLSSQGRCRLPACRCRQVVLLCVCVSGVAMCV